MQGFEGPFRFEIDTDGTELPWESLDPNIKAELLSDGTLKESSSRVFLFKIAVAPSTYRLEKHHDWSKVSRLLVQAKVENGMKLGGIAPRDKSVSNARQMDLGFDGKLKAEISLFSMANLKVALSHFAKNNATATRHGLLSSCTRRFAQWVYSHGWPFIDFKSYVYVAVPESVPPSSRRLEVAIKALRKGNVELTQVGVWGHLVRLA